MEITLIKKREYPELRALQKAFDINKKGELCVAVGGDGTFIRAAREFDGPILPIRSKDKDSVGYYADVCIDDMDTIVKKLKNKEYSVERLANKIEVEFKGRKYYAVNEAALNNELEEVSFKIYEIANGRREEIYPYIMGGDGILITSVVGSTAYNKSAGGPIILSPEVFCMTFLNVDGPYRNPVVVDSEKVIEVEIIKYNGRLRYDGMEIGIIKPGERFRVRLSGKELKIVRLNGLKESFGAKLERIIKSRMEK